ncbi:MAG TPA: aldehyde dehydrogenase family protein, partial [Pyrinomonadaceae bacterium]
MAIASINPATGETLKTFEPLTDQQLDQKLERAVQTFRHYRRLSIADREPLMRRAAEILEKDKDRFARMMTIEMGKPIRAAVQEVEKCASVCRYYADHAAEHLLDRLVETTASKS